MTNPRKYPDEIRSVESGRPMRRGIKTITIEVDGHPFTYQQPGWWCSLDDPDDSEGQLVDEDNTVARAARREAKALAKANHTGRKKRVLTPLVIRAIREKCGLTQEQAGKVFGVGKKVFEKYEAGETQPSSGVRTFLIFAASDPDKFREWASRVDMEDQDERLIRQTVLSSSVEDIWRALYEA